MNVRQKQPPKITSMTPNASPEVVPWSSFPEGKIHGVKRCNSVFVRADDISERLSEIKGIP
jgi:hypothetical protein